MTSVPEQLAPRDEPEATLPGPSRTITVEPIQVPREEPAPAQPEEEPVPAEPPSKEPEREPDKAPA